jgi:hypothetical protein
MRPRKETLFMPQWPLKERVPWEMVRLQARLWRFWFVWATPLPLRPASFRVNARLPPACSLRLKEKVVPTGGRCLREKVACASPSRQVALACETPLRTGLAPGVQPVPNEPILDCDLGN